MKGVAGITTIIVGLIFITAIVIGIIMPIPFLKVHLVRTIEFEFKYNYAELSLLTLLSSTHNNKPVSEIIADNIFFDRDKSELNFLEDKLDKIVESKCYKLSYSGSLHNRDVLASRCNPSEYTATSRIVFPFNPTELSGELTLVID